MRRSTKYFAIFLPAAVLLAAEAPGDAGDLDTSFNPGSGANDSVFATAVQPDGKVIIAGKFTSYNNVAQNRVARLNSNGTLDNTLNVGSGPNDTVFAVALQPNGQIIIGGAFTTINGAICRRIERLNANGSQDTSFDPTPGFDATTGANGNICAIAIQSDGKVIIGGDFSIYRTVARNNIARLNADGMLDTSFNPGAGADFGVRAIALAAEGKVYIGGSFNTVNGFQRPGIARLNTNGSVDSSFAPTNDNIAVNALALQPDARLLVGGTGLNSPGPLYSLMRLDSNGNRDTTFEGYGSGETDAIQLRSDGKILFGGTFAGGAKLLRRNSNGTHDPTFDIGAQPNDRVRSLSPAAADKVVLGGDFTAYGNAARGRVARIFNATPPVLRNIATRSAVQTGERVAIAGFIISGNGPKEVLLRGIGPSLTPLGVPGALQDPMIELYNSSGGLINSNNNWRDTQQNAILESTLQPSDDREAALLINLGPGSYTVVHKGANQTTGNGLIEVYDLTGGTATKLANISTRAFVGNGDNVLIGGFILAGDDTRIVVRGIGPSLGAAGVSGALADPRVALYNGNGALVGFNQDWRDGQQAEIAATGLQPSNDLEAALVVTLQAGNYTAIVEGLNGSTGVGLVEVYNVAL